MTASEDRRRDDDFTSWAGHGVPIGGPDEVEFVIAPRLERALRAYVASMDGLSAPEREEVRRVLGNALRHSAFRARPRLGTSERRHIDELLRKAGLPPLR